MTRIEKMMWTLVGGLIVAVVIQTAVVQGAELAQTDRGFNWQDRDYFGRAYTERQLGGGDATSGESGDAGAAAGATGGDSGGNGCGR